MLLRGRTVDGVWLLGEFLVDGNCANELCVRARLCALIERDEDASWSPLPRAPCDETIERELELLLILCESAII
jgi:hypothetical protein